MVKLWNTTATAILVMRWYILVVIGGAKCRRRCCGGGGGHEFARPFEQSIDQMSDFITALGVNRPRLMVVHIFCYYLWFWNDKRGIRCRSCWQGTNMTDLWGRHRESYPCHPFYKDYQCTFPFLQKEIHESARRGLEPLLLVSSISTKIKNHNNGSCRWWRRISGYLSFLSCVAVTQPERNGQSRNDVALTYANCMCGPSWSSIVRTRKKSNETVPFDSLARGLAQHEGDVLQNTSRDSSIAAPLHLYSVMSNEPYFIPSSIVHHRKANSSYKLNRNHTLIIHIHIDT